MKIKGLVNVSVLPSPPGAFTWLYVLVDQETNELALNDDGTVLCIRQPVLAWRVETRGRYEGGDEYDLFDTIVPVFLGIGCPQFGDQSVNGWPLTECILQETTGYWCDPILSSEGWGGAAEFLARVIELQSIRNNVRK